MVRETRYLWVANLPENVKEERISEHFKRYGKIQSVKFRKDNDVILGALVAFTDIKSAEKAQNSENVLEGNVLRTEYSEPGASILSLRTTAQTLDPSNNDGGTRNAFRTGFARAGDGEKGEESSKKEVAAERGRPRERFTGNHPAVPIAGDGIKVVRPAYMNADKSRRKANGPAAAVYSRSPSTESSTGSRSSSSSTDRSRSISNKSQSSRQKKPMSMQSRTASEEGHLGIFITGLPLRSTDSSLRDGLFHEYKKYGKVVAVSVQGAHADRFAIVTFKKHDDAAKAKEGSQGRRFFGAKIVVTEHEGIEPEDSEYRPPEAELDEYHPKATRTLFVGNLEKDISAQELKEIFSEYGEIIDVDIKKQAQGSSYAFVQFTDINSVVRALHKMDGENIGANKVKLGFGKSMPTNCVWIDNVTDAITEKSLCRQFSRHGIVQSCHIDRELQRALLYYDTVEIAQYTTSDVRGRLMGGRKLQVDFASRDCQLNFFEKMEKTHQLRPGDYPDERLMMRSARPSFDGNKPQSFDSEETPRGAGTFESGGRRGRYENSRYGGGAGANASGGGSGPGAAPAPAYDRRQSAGSSFRGGADGRPYPRAGGANSRSFRGGGGGEGEEFPERRRRHADEFSQTSSGYGNDDYEAELREYSQRSRRDPYDSQSPLDSRDSSPAAPRRMNYYDYPDRYSERYDDDPRYRQADAGGGSSTKVVRKVTKKERNFSPTNSDYSQSVSSHGGYRSRSESPSERRGGKRVRTPVPTSPGHDDFIQPTDDEVIKRKRVKKSMRALGTTSDSESDLEYEVRCSEKGAVKRLREEAGYRSGTSDPEALKRKFNLKVRNEDSKRGDSDSEGEVHDYDVGLHKSLQEKKELLQKLKQLDDSRDDSENEERPKLDVSLSCRKQMEARRSEESKPVPERSANQSHEPMDDSELGPDSLHDVPPEYCGLRKGKKDKKKRTKEVFKPPESLDARPEKAKREPMDLPLPKFAYEIGFQSPKVVNMSPRPHASPKGVMSPQISPSVKTNMATPPFSPPLQSTQNSLTSSPAKDVVTSVKPLTVKTEPMSKDSIGSPLSDNSSPTNSPPLSPAHMSLEDRIRALDEKISKAESVRTVPTSSASCPDASSAAPATNHTGISVNCSNSAPVVPNYSKFKVKKKVDVNKQGANGEKDSADTVTSRILARTSVFDLDSRRLEQKSLDDTAPLPISLALNDDVTMATDFSDMTATPMDVTSSSSTLANASVTLPSSSVLSSVTEALRQETTSETSTSTSLLKPSSTLPFTTNVMTSLSVDTSQTDTVVFTSDTASGVKNSTTLAMDTSSPLTSPVKLPAAPPVGILKKTTSPPRPGILKKAPDNVVLCNGPSKEDLKPSIKVEPSPNIDDDTPDLSPVVETSSNSWRTPGKDAPSMPVLKPETDIFKPEPKPEPADLVIGQAAAAPPLLTNSTTGNKRKSENSSDAPNAKIPKIESKKTDTANRDHKTDKKDSSSSKTVKSDPRKDKSVTSSKDSSKHSSSSKDSSKGVSSKSDSSSKHSKNDSDKPSDKLKSVKSSDNSKSVDSSSSKDKHRSESTSSSKTHKSDSSKDRTKPSTDSSTKASSDSSKKPSDKSSDNSSKPVIKTSSDKDKKTKDTKDINSKSDHKDKSSDNSKSKSVDKSMKPDKSSSSKDKKDVPREKEGKKDKKEVKKEEPKDKSKVKEDTNSKDSKEAKKEHGKDKKTEDKKDKKSEKSNHKEPRDKDGKGPNGSSKGGGSHGSSSNDKNSGGGSGSGSSERNHDNGNQGNGGGGNQGNSSGRSGGSNGGSGNHGNNNNNNNDHHGNQASKESRKKDKKDRNSSSQQKQSSKEKKERVPAAFRELKELGIDYETMAGFSSMYDNIKRRSSKPARPDEKTSPVGSKKRRPSYLDSEGTPDSSDDSEDVFSDKQKKQKKKSPNKITSKPKKNHVLAESSTSSDDNDDVLLKKDRKAAIKKSPADVYTSSESDSRITKKPASKFPKSTPKKTETTKNVKKPKEVKKSKNRGIYTSSDSDSESEVKPKVNVKKKKYDAHPIKPSKPVTSKGKLSELYKEISSSDAESSDDEITTFQHGKKEKLNNFDIMTKKKPKQHKLTSKEEEDLKKNNLVFDKLSSQIKALSDDHNKINERKIHELKSNLELLNQRQKSSELARERTTDKAKFDKTYDKCVKMVMDLEMQAMHDNISRSNSKYLDKSSMITKDSMYNRDLPLSLTESKTESKLNSFDIHRVHDEQARKKHKAKQRLKHENSLLDVKDLNRINYEKKHHECKQRQNDVIKLNDVTSFNKPIMFNHVNHNDSYFDDVHVPIENEGVDNVAEEQTIETMYETPSTGASEVERSRDYKLQKDEKGDDSDSEPLPELIIEEEPRKDVKSEEPFDQPELELKRSAEETSQAAKMLEEVTMNEESWNCSSGLVIEEDQPDDQLTTGQDELEAAIASLASGGLVEEEIPYREVPVAQAESDKEKSFGERSIDRSFSEVEAATKALEGGILSPLVSPTIEPEPLKVVTTPEVKQEELLKTPEVMPGAEKKLFPTLETPKIERVEPKAEVTTPEVVAVKPQALLMETPEEPPETPKSTPAASTPMSAAASTPMSITTPSTPQDDVMADLTVEAETPHSSKHKKKKHHHHHKKRQRRDSRRSTDQELEAPHLDTALVIADDKIQVEPPLAPLEHLQSMSAELFKPREEAPSIGTETDSKPDHITSSGDDMKPSMTSPPHHMTSPTDQDAPLVPPLVISTDKTPKRRPRKAKTKQPPKEPMSDISLTIDGVLNDYDEDKAETPSTGDVESRSESKMSDASCDSTETGTSPRRKSPARTPGAVVSNIKTRLRPEDKRRKPRRSLYTDENENKDKLAPPGPELLTLSEKEREKKMSEYDFHDEIDDDNSAPPTRWRSRDEVGKDDKRDEKDDGKDEGQLVIDEGEEEEKTKKKKKRRDGSPREAKGSPAQALDGGEEDRPSLVTVLQVSSEGKKKRAKRSRKDQAEKDESHDEFQFKEDESTERLQDEVIAMAERAAADAETEIPDIKEKKKKRTISSEGSSDFLSNIDKIINEVADGNFDINSIQDDPAAPPRRRGSRSNSKIHEDRPPSRDAQTPNGSERQRKSSQSESVPLPGSDSMPPPQYAPYHQQERFHQGRPGSPDKTSPITPATPQQHFSEKQRLKSPDQHQYRSDERSPSPNPSSQAKYYHPPADGLVVVARDQESRHENSIKGYQPGERVFFPPERHMERKEHTSKSPSGKLSPRSQSVHMGVVQGAPFTIAQRDALERSGQMIERVPNPNLAMMGEGLMAEKLSPSEVAKLHSPKLSVPPPQIMTSDMGLKSNTPLASPNHAQMLHGPQKAPPGAPGPPGPSELRAMLSQPSRMPQQGLRPPSNPPDMQLSPGMRLHQDPRRDAAAAAVAKHELAAAAHLEAAKIPADAYLRALPPGDPRHAAEQFYHPDFLQPGLMYGPGGIPVALDPRVMFPGQRPEFMPQQSPHLPIAMVHPQQYPSSHGGRLTPESRPPSRPLSAHAQHGMTGIPGPGLPYFQMNAIDAPTPTDHLLKKYPVMWQGCLALKNDSANVQMHFVSGGEGLVRQSLPDQPVQDGNLNVLRIAQRMRLEASQLDAVAKRMEDKANYCMLLALPCGRDDGDLMVQTEQLKTGFIHYLQHKQAAGIVNTNAPGTQQAAYVVHIFPPCDFSKTMLARAAADLLRSCVDIPHVLIVIATV